MTRSLAFLACFVATAACAASGHLGASPAIDPSGRVWMASAESGEPMTHVVVARLEGGVRWTPPMYVTHTREPVSADGENRPKIAFGPRGEIYVSWTSPTSAQYTANIRFARSLDAGKTWSAPITVHHDRQLIAHRFESLLVDRDGRIWLAWIDKRDLTQAQLAQHDYAGAAIYYAYSQDRGLTWSDDRKLADHSCECCRIALALDPQGRVLAMWRHVFANSERDHAVAVLDPVRAPIVERATHDRWRVDACPHHGPGLAIARDGVRHAVWFNQVDGRGRVFYGRLAGGGPKDIRQLPAGATHADIAAAGDLLAIAWKRFDGEATRVESWISRDGGGSFSDGPSFASSSGSDQPRLVGRDVDVLLVWRRTEGVVTQALGESALRRVAQSQGSTEGRKAGSQTVIKPFARTTLAEVERAHAGEPFWLVLWDLECTYCAKSLRNLASAQQAQPSLRAVTIATDSAEAGAALRERLAELRVVSDAYAFADESPEALRFAIDPKWAGEKPRAYRYDANGKRRAVTGVIDIDQYR